MKKTIAFILALVMALGLTTAAFAEEEKVTEAGDSNKAVTATYDDKTTTIKLYNVNIDWDKLAFTYSESGTKTWNPSTHTYDESADYEKGWDETEATITVTNHSAFAVNASIKFTEGTKIAGVEAKFDDVSATLDAPVLGSNQNTAKSLTGKLTIEGNPDKPSELGTSAVTLGSITITISAVDNTTA